MMSNNLGTESQLPQGERASSRIWLWLVIAAALAAGAFFLLRRPAAAEKAEPKKESAEEHGEHDSVTMPPDAQRNIGLKVAAVRSGAVVETIQATGTVGPNETRVVPLRPLARGRVEKVNVRLGDPVRKGQALVVYDNIELGELTGQYMSAFASLKKAEADASATKRSAERAAKLVGEGAIAAAELERRNAEAASSVAAINTQKAELDRIDEKFHRFGLTEEEIKRLETGPTSHRGISRTTMVAPFDGVVTAYSVSEGEVVDISSQLLTVADLSTVWIQANIYEKDIAAVRVGLTVPVTSETYPGEEFACRTTYIGDILDPKTRTAKMRCEIPNRDRRLKVDMFVNLKVPSPAGRRSILVPSVAIQHVQDKPVVFVRENDTTFKKRDVTLGATSGDMVEVRSGLKEGEQVVTAGSFQMKSLLLRAEIGGEE